MDKNTRIATLAHRLGFLLELPEADFRHLLEIQQEHDERHLRQVVREQVQTMRQEADQ